MCQKVINAYRIHSQRNLLLASFMVMSIDRDNWCNMTTQKSIPARLHTIKRTSLQKGGQEAFEAEIPLSALAQQARSNPASLTSDHVLRLQRAIGNKAMTGLTQIQ